MAENWAQHLQTIALRALRLSIDNLILTNAPLALNQSHHPVNKFLGGPPQDVENDVDQLTRWYNAAHTMFSTLSDFLESDDANLTSVWAAGHTDRVIRVLGQNVQLQPIRGPPLG